MKKYLFEKLYNRFEVLGLITVMYLYGASKIGAFDWLALIMLIAICSVYFERSS